MPTFAASNQINDATMVKLNSYLQYLGRADKCFALRTALLLVISREGISVDLAYKLLKCPKPLLVENIRKLADMGVMSCGFGTVSCSSSYADSIRFTPTPNIRTLGLVLSSMISSFYHRKREVVVPARLLLTYMLEHPQLWEGNAKLVNLFAKLVIMYAPRHEESLAHNQRKAVEQVEDRLDYRLLELVAHLESDYRAPAFGMMADLYIEAFKYERAEECIEESVRLGGENPWTLLARARFNENFGYTAKALLYAHRAYLKSVEMKNFTARDEARLYLARLCADCGDVESSQAWLEQVHGLSEEQKIAVAEIKALHCQDDGLEANRYADEAELRALRLYGNDCPELARIALVRSIIAMRQRKPDNGIGDYQRYIELCQLNYGRAVGALLILYACKINERLYRDDIRRAQELYQEIMALDAEPHGRIGYGVRLAMALQAALLHIETDKLEEAGKFIQEGLDLCQEAIPDDAEKEELAQIFQNGHLPEELMLMDSRRLLLNWQFQVLVSSGNTREAIELCEQGIRMETGKRERRAWRLNLGLARACRGEIAEGLYIWKKAIREAEEEDRPNVLLTVARYTKLIGYLSYSLTLYQELISMREALAGTPELLDVYKEYNKLIEELD